MQLNNLVQFQTLSQEDREYWTRRSNQSPKSSQFQNKIYL